MKLTRAAVWKLLSLPSDDLSSQTFLVRFLIALILQRENFLWLFNFVSSKKLDRLKNKETNKRGRLAVERLARGN